MFNKTIQVISWSQTISIDWRLSLGTTVSEMPPLIGIEVWKQVTCLQA